MRFSIKEEKVIMLKINFLSARAIGSYARLSVLVLGMLMVFVATPLAWRTYGAKWGSIPVTYSTYYVSVSWQSTINNAASAWSQADWDHFRYEPYGGYDHKVTFLETPGSAYLGRSEATYDYSGSQILGHVNIYIYAAWPWWTQWADGPPGTVHLYTTVAHELGHALGLDHSEDPNAVMAQTVENTTSNIRHDLTLDDENGVRGIYASGGGDICKISKPAIADRFMSGEGFTNWDYVSRLAYSAGLIGEDFEKTFASQGQQILKVINSDPAIREQTDQLTESLARDMHVSLSQGKGYDAPLTASRIQEIDNFLEALSSRMVLDPKLQEFRSLLRGSEGRSFWSVLSEVAHQQAITVPTLRQNLPNPFNPNTIIDFELPEEAYVRLQVYNLSGQLVRTLMAQIASSGRHRIVWGGKDDLGHAVSTGIYIYRLEIPSSGAFDKFFNVVTAD